MLPAEKVTEVQGEIQIDINNWPPITRTDLIVNEKVINILVLHRWVRRWQKLRCCHQFVLNNNSQTLLLSPSHSVLRFANEVVTLQIGWFLRGDQMWSGPFFFYNYAYDGIPVRFCIVVYCASSGGLPKWSTSNIIYIYIYLFIYLFLWLSFRLICPVSTNKMTTMQPTWQAQRYLGKVSLFLQAVLHATRMLYPPNGCSFPRI